MNDLGSTYTAIPQPIYDTEWLEIGKGTAKFFCDPRGKSDSETNFVGTLPGPQAMIINGLAVQTDEETEKIIGEGSFELVIGCARYIRMAPINLLFRKRGATSNNENAYKIEPNLVLPCAQNIKLTLNWDAPGYPKNNEIKDYHRTRKTRAYILGALYTESMTRDQ
jgi:hypothetical protein